MGRRNYGLGSARLRKGEPAPLGFVEARLVFLENRDRDLLGVAGDHRTERLSHSSNRVGPMRGLAPGVRLWSFTAMP